MLVANRSVRSADGLGRHGGALAEKNRHWRGFSIAASVFRLGNQLRPSAPLMLALRIGTELEIAKVWTRGIV